MNVSDFDQMQAALGDLSKTLFEYYKKLLKEGFKPMEEIPLVVEMQRGLMGFDNKK